MDVHYRKDELREYAEDERKAIKRYGRAVGRKYVERVNLFKELESVQQLRDIGFLRFHALKVEREPVRHRPQ